MTPSAPVDKPAKARQPLACSSDSKACSVKARSVGSADGLRRCFRTSQPDVGVTLLATTWAIACTLLHVCCRLPHLCWVRTELLNASARASQDEWRRHAASDTMHSCSKSSCSAMPNQNARRPCTHRTADIAPAPKHFNCSECPCSTMLEAVCATVEHRCDASLRTLTPEKRSSLGTCMLPC